MASFATVIERLETAQTLAWRLFRLCRKADPTFRVIRTDIRALHTALLDVHDDVTHSAALYASFDEEGTHRELCRTTNTCLANLETLRELFQGSNASGYTWYGESKVEYLQDAQIKIQSDIQNLQQLGDTLVGRGSAPMSRSSSNNEPRAEAPTLSATLTSAGVDVARGKKGVEHQATVEECDDFDEEPSPAIEHYQILVGKVKQVDGGNAVNTTTADQTARSLGSEHLRHQSQAGTTFDSRTSANTTASPKLIDQTESPRKENTTSKTHKESRRPSEIPQLVLPQKERRSTQDMEDEIARLEKENRRMRRQNEEREDRRNNDEDGRTRHDSLTPDTTSHHRRHGRPRSRTTGSLSPGSSDDYESRHSPLESPRSYGEDKKSDRYKEDRERRKRHTPYHTPRTSPRHTPKHSPTSPRQPTVLHQDEDKHHSSRRRRSSERTPRSPRTPRLEIRPTSGRTSSNESPGVTPQSAGPYSPRNPIDVFNDFVRKEDGVPGHDFPLFSDGSEDERPRHKRAPPSPKADTREPVQSKLPVSLEDLFSGCTKKVIVPRTKYDPRVGSQISDDRSMDVTIPKGLRTGTRFQYKSIVGDTESLRDLQLVIVEKPHPSFTRKENDLEVKLDIELLESLLGWERTITTICGKSVKVGDRKPTSPQWRVKVPKFGMPLHSNPSERGDLVVGVNIKYPALLAPSQKDALRAALTPRYAS